MSVQPTMYSNKILINYKNVWLSGAITQSQNGPGSDGNERALCIAQSSSIIGT